MGKIYRNPKTYEIPDLDLITFCFDSPHSTALPESILHCDGEVPSLSLNKAGLQRLFEEFAYGLRNRFGIGANGPNTDVVVIFSTGQPAYPAAFWAVIAAGGVASLASPSGTAHELARQFAAGEGNILIVSEDLLETARNAVKLLVEQGVKKSKEDVTICVLNSSPDWSLRIDNMNYEDGELRGKLPSERLAWKRITDPEELSNSLIVLLYSSGTTGTPKGVMLSHQNFVAQLTILAMPSREFIASEIASGNLTATPPPSRSLAHLPAAHIAGTMSYLVAPVLFGGTVFWMRKYTWKTFLRLAGERRISSIYTVPSIYLRMAKDPAVKDQFKYLIAASGGAAPMDAALQKAAGSKTASGHVHQTWGLSETTGAVTAMVRGGQADETGSISPLLPNVEMRFVDENDKDVPEGEPGEILVRGPIVTKGYFKNPEATTGAFRNGWFATGDIGVVRDGKFYIVDRIKELIKYKGLQIAPAEIEGLLITHSEIMEAAVVGIPEQTDTVENAASQGPKSSVAHSEVPRAYVVRMPGSNISTEEVSKFIRDRLAPYKQLRGGVVFIEEIPKNALGKMLRRELKERALMEVTKERTSKL